MKVLGRWKKVAVAGGMVAAMTLGAAVGVNAQTGEDNAGGSPAPEPRAGALSPSESVYVPITPCRIVNTTIGSKIAANQTRSYRSQGNTAAQGGAASCGIPASASAIEVNMTGTFADGDGYLRVAPTGVPIPTATFLNYEAGFNASNAGTIALTPGAGNNFQVRAFVAPTHLVVDVLGYYVRGLMAVVGPTGTLVRGNNVVSVVRESAGEYRVNFDRNVSGCAFSGGLHDTGTGFGVEGDLAMATNGSNANGVYVETYNEAGTQADIEFHVVVSC